MTVLLLFLPNRTLCGDIIFNNRLFQHFGELSFSIFIWHQIIFAFRRYYISDEVTPLFLLGFGFVVMLLSFITYRWVEQVVINKKVIVIYTIALIIISSTSLLIYKRACVIRDVAELDISFDNLYTSRNTEYTDKIYDYNKEFTSSDKIKILVVGNSFARDMACVLLESKYADKIELSYSFSYKEEIIDRIEESNFIFSFPPKKSIPDYVWNNITDSSKIWGIGTKNYGKSNGPIYVNRFNSNYFEQTVELDKNYALVNKLWEDEWGDNYINFIEMSKDKDGRIRVFTPNHKFISQDCRHLTKNGAKYYASIINFKNIFNQ